jgi:8-oxo-dGTP pyrophosphatase MutT (NUDIX family)
MAVKRIADAYRRLRRAPPIRRVAAAVAVRARDGDGVEFLLVRTRNSERWTFPKGGREPGETLAQAAAREAIEEAGAHGRVGERPVAAYVYGEDVVTAFLLEVDETRAPVEGGRDPAWFGLEDACGKLAEGRDGAFGERMRAVLLAAERARDAGNLK